ncbi:MAG: TIGR03617 family F420-dependent LLM class oxidoreductase [Rhodospirillaceae bacterium]|jgi:probable F420-dependent oxidoreductase|nr:TIGR03617 family F420-dependent LLM class oxidoreductase [Rhodospirillaceae bacterium]
MRVMTRLSQKNLNQTQSAAQAAEATGFDGLATMENSNNPFLPLAIAATTTERIELMTGIAIAFARSPMAVANMAHDLQLASGGRFKLGLGSQVKGHNERRFSVPWTPPAPRMKEYVESLRAIWRCWETGAPLDYVGDHYKFTLMTPHFVPEKTNLPMTPITIAAVGPAMLRVAGRYCDGAQLHPFCTRRYVEEVVMKRIGEGMEKSNLTRENFEISGGGFIVTGPDQETVNKIFEYVRYRVAFYGSTRTYWPVFELHGLTDLGGTLHRLSKAGKWDEMAREIPDDVVHLFAAVGHHDEIAKAIEDRFGGLSDSVDAIAAPDAEPDLPPGLVQDIQKIGSPFKGFATAW